MCLDVAAPAPDIVLELSPRLAEGVAYGDVGVGVRSMLVRRTVDHDALARHADLDQYPVELALVVVPVRSFDRNPTADDPVEELLELINPSTDVSGMPGTL